IPDMGCREEGVLDEESIPDRLAWSWHNGRHACRIGGGLCDLAGGFDGSGEVDRALDRVRQGAVRAERQGAVRLRRGSRRDQSLLWRLREGLAAAADDW